MVCWTDYSNNWFAYKEGNCIHCNKRKIGRSNYLLNNNVIWIGIFAFLSAKIIQTEASKKAKASAIGKDIQTPTIPKNEGSIKRQGNKNRTYLAEERTVAGKPLPIAWKKKLGINWIPRVKNIIATEHKQPSTGVMLY